MSRNGVVGSVWVFLVLSLGYVVLFFGGLIFFELLECFDRVDRYLLICIVYGFFRGLVFRS